MLRRSAYEEVGGFSEEFTLFYADVDFCLKVRNAGYYTVFTPHVLLSHLHSVSRMRIRSKEISIRRRKEPPYCSRHGQASSIERCLLQP